jgi:hypothetical protein
MRCLQETNPGNFSDIETTVKSYAQWVIHNQNEADPNSIDIRTEPKFEVLQVLLIINLCLHF